MGFERVCFFRDLYSFLLGEPHILERCKSAIDRYAQCVLNDEFPDYVCTNMPLFFASTPHTCTTIARSRIRQVTPMFARDERLREELVQDNVPCSDADNDDFVGFGDGEVDSDDADKPVVVNDDSDL